MKKFLVLIACLLLAVFATGSVGADDDTTENALSDSTEVIYNINSVYTLIIPSKFTFGGTDEFLPIELMTKSSKLGEYQQINITVNSSQFDENQPDGTGGKGLWTLIHKNGLQVESKLYYHIHTYDDVPIKNGSSVFTATGREVAEQLKMTDIGTANLSIEQNLHFKLNDTEPGTAGLFKDLLIFTIKLEYVPSDQAN